MALFSIGPISNRNLLPSSPLPQNHILRKSGTINSSKPLYQVSYNQLAVSTLPAPQTTVINSQFRFPSYSGFQSGAQAARNLSSAASNQRELDKAKGTGLLQGASHFAKAYMSGVVQMEHLFQAPTSGSQPAEPSYSGPRNNQKNNELLALAASFAQGDFEKLGEKGRSHLLNTLFQDATTAAMENQGIRSVLQDLGLLENSAGALTTGAATSAASGTQASTAISSGAAEVGAASTGVIGLGTRALSFLGAAYSGYQLLENWGKTDPVTGAMNGAAAGAYIGSVIPGVGTLIGGAVGGLIGAISGFFGESGKDAHQLQRDQIRSGLQQYGLIDKDFMLTLANGSKYDIGKDGGFKLQNLDGSFRPTYNTDPSNPLSAVAIGLVNPLAHILAAGNAKATSDLAAMLANAATSNATSLEDVRQNVLMMVKSLGIDEAALRQAVVSTALQGKISRPEAEAFLNGVATLFNADLLKSQNPTLMSPDETAQVAETAAQDFPATA